MKKSMLGLLMLCGFACAPPPEPEAMAQSLINNGGGPAPDCSSEPGICTCSGDAQCKAMESLCVPGTLECSWIYTVCWCIQENTPDRTPTPPKSVPPGAETPGGTVLK